MQAKYRVTPQESRLLTEIPGDWTTSDFYEILRLVGYGDADDLDAQEIKGMAMFCLYELEMDEAAELILNYVFPPEALTPGQVRDLSYDMESEKMWEAYPDLTFHRRFFRAGSLLYQAFNGGFPKTKARKVTLHVTPQEELDKSFSVFPPPAFVARLLAKGMKKDARLPRFYEEERTQGRQPNASTIIWSCRSTANGDGSYQFDIIGSDYWLEGIESAVPYFALVSLEEEVVSEN